MRLLLLFIFISCQDQEQIKPTLQRKQVSKEKQLDKYFTKEENQQTDEFSDLKKDEACGLDRNSSGTAGCSVQ